jgi:beta-lactamase regulating signal transducer with metallopeptidase domain
MDTLLQSWFGGERGVNLLRFILDISIRVSVLCLLAGAATVALRRASAYTRKMIWVSALVGLLLLPFLAFINPVWNISIIPDLGRWGGVFGGSGVEEVLSGSGSGVESSLRAAGGANGARDSLAGPWFFSSWTSLVFLVWALGASALLGWLLMTGLYVRRALRDAEPVDRSWYRLESDLRARIGLRHAVPLLKSNRTSTAVTTGVFFPIVILPIDADRWSKARRQLVLAHELAHVKRKDGLIELLASIAVVLHWFNPLVWMAVARFRIERERDCDNAVLNDGVRPSEYASLLLDIAADVSGLGRPVWRLSTISQSSNLKNRLLCILNPTVDRTTGNRRCAMKAVALILAVIVPISLFGVWDTKAEEKKPPPPPKEEVAKKMSMTWEKIAEKEGSAAAMVAKVIDEKGIDVGMKKCMAMKEKKSDKYYFDEKEFNTLGYRYLYNGDHDKAIGVFKLNVKSYPDSWNVYDSLGEAYAHNGELKKAMKYYEKSLQMNPENENGKKMLKKIQHKMQGGEEKVEKKVKKKS